MIRRPRADTHKMILAAIEGHNGVGWLDLQKLLGTSITACRCAVVDLERAGKVYRENVPTPKHPGKSLDKRRGQCVLIKKVPT